MLERRYRGGTLSVITTGTTFGIVVGGPVAFAVGGGWRAAWLLFAVAAFAVMVWNLLILPSGPHGEVENRPRLRAGWFFGRRSTRLFAVAFVFGFGGTVYWTYAVDLVERAGLRFSLAAGMAALGAAPALLGISHSSWAAAGISAVLFGATFMIMSALLVNWTSAVFPGQPGTGFSATQLFIAAGTIAGPAAMGTFAEPFSLQTALLITAVLVLASVAVSPAEEKGE
jgi:predicted MFS family arabinose efflux permease